MNIKEQEVNNSGRNGGVPNISDTQKPGALGPRIMPEEGASASEESTGRIILMRHGRTFSNVGHYLDTRPPGAELTDIGRSQAIDAGRRLRILAPNLGAAVSSIALRAQQSLHLAMHGYGATNGSVPGVGQSSIPIAVYEGLHEIFAGDFEGDNSELALSHYHRAVVQWQAGSLDARLPGGESPQELLSRFLPGLAKARLLAGGSDVLVVSHGAAIRLIGYHGTTLDKDLISSRYLANGSLAIIEPVGDFGQWKCVQWADERV